MIKLSTQPDYFVHEISKNNMRQIKISTLKLSL